ncbi:MAG: hypothetical protein CML66_06445 [Rhodobacteraceae bacterium]|nr:hypothetical protein [Paracoccaceae bacterium]MAY47511.1 hypothetical protein [Paracoccaceae bacterium]QEW21677.1 putative small protein [Marinibacterium anthonyi]
MNEKYEFPEEVHPIVYVKTVDVADLPEEVQAEAGGLDHLYAVHDAEGQQLALVADRRMAFVLARQNDFAPVAVH